MSRVLLTTTLAAIVWASFVVAAQQPVVRGGVDEVRVEIHATDNRGNPVTDLQPGDLEITDDGQPQKILTFTLVKAGAPSSPGATIAATPGASVVPPPSAAAEPRAVVIVLDDLHVDRGNTPRVTRAVKSFVETVVSPSDAVAVVFTSGENHGGQDFTSDRSLVLSAIDQFRGQKLRSAAVERQQDPLIRLSGQPTDHIDPVEPERENRARIVMDALTRIGETLGRMADRRSLVLLVSEGPEYDQVQRRRSGTSDQWSMNDGIQRAVQALNRANAMVYAIDPRGVSAGNPAQIESSSTVAGSGTSAIQTEKVLAFGVLQAMAVNTGGIAMPWRPDMRDGYRRIVDANGSYYVAGYALPATNRGAYHRIAVQVRRRGVQVRARSGYFLPQ